MVEVSYPGELAVRGLGGGSNSSGVGGPRYALYAGKTISLSSPKSCNSPPSQPSLSVESERLLAGVEEQEWSAVDACIVCGEDGAVESVESAKILTGCG